MKHRLGIIALSFLVIGVIPGAFCQAAVTLGFQIGGATPTTIYELPGSTFLMSVVVTGAGEQMIGVDYHFLASTSSASNASNVFSVFSRTSSTSFNMPFESDPGVAAADQSLAPDTSFNLGANTANFSPLTVSGTVKVADYMITVSSTAPVGSKYTFSFSNITSDALDYNTPAFTDASFSSTGSFTVFTPEPSCIALIGLSLISLRRHRPRRCQ
jgi:hypothetical protein